MMKELKRILYEKGNAILLTLYLWFIWMAYIFVFITDRTSYLLIWSVVICFVGYFITSHLLHWIEKMQLEMNSTERTAKQKRCIFALGAGVSILVLLIWFWGYFPGGYSPDSLSQYRQATSGNYNDWHPTWHTLLFFTLPLKISGGMVCSSTVLQMVYFALVMGYLCVQLDLYIGRKAVVYALLYILLNPYTGAILMYPWKDVAFSITVLLAMILVMKQYFTKGKYLASYRKCILLAVIFANATLFRHNGILFTGSMILALCFWLNRKQWGVLFTTFLLFLIVVKGPVYVLLDVETAGSRISETMGVPLTIMGNVVVENPNVMDRELQEFVYSIASEELWQERYVYGSFNSIKWAGVDLTRVNNTSIFKILQLTGKCFLYAPKASMRSFLALTNMVYAVEGSIEGDIGVGVSDNEYGFQYQGSQDIAGFLKGYKNLFSQTIFKYFRYLGTSILLMLVAILGRNKLNCFEDWKRIFLCLPILVYNFGTMLLLTGDDSRFFYASFLVCPIVIAIACYRRTEGAKE